MKCVLFGVPEQIISPGLFGNKKYLKNATLPPLGLLYIAAVIEKLGHSVEIIDFRISNYSIHFYALFRSF